MTRIIIRGVPVRAAYIAYLKEQLPEAEWCMDQRANAMDTFLRAMRMAGDGPCLHMEDDAILCDDFRARTENEIEKRPTEVIQFFSARKNDLLIGSRYEQYFSYGICMYIPAGLSRRIADYWETWPESRKAEHPTGLDTMMDDMFRQEGRKHWIVVPSLVDHRIGTSTINPRRNRNRQSKTFGRVK